MEIDELISTNEEADTQVFMQQKVDSTMLISMLKTVT